jgi:hypothetical protein
MLARTTTTKVATQTAADDVHCGKAAAVVAEALD